MKKIKLSSKVYAVIMFSLIQFVCIVIVSAFILQRDSVCPVWVDIVSCVCWIIIAIGVEIVKYNYIKGE